MSNIEKGKKKKVKAADDNENAKKKKKNESVEDIAIQDVFNRDVLIDIKTDKCAMCKGNHEVGLRLKEKVIVRMEDDEEPEDLIKLHDKTSILDVTGVWASRYSMQGKHRRLFLHYYCALNSPRAIFNGKEWCNLSKEVHRAQCLKCKYCGLNGASLGCLDTRCSVVMHVPCAVKLGFRRCGFKMSFFCAEHTQANINKERKLDEESSKDISHGQEPVPVTFVNTLDDALPSQELEYTKKSLDSVDVAANLRSIHELDCCKCEGLCDDVTQCACLAQGRNYTFTGGLIPGTHARILECNLRCSCSIRRCTNRVVEKGPTARLEVFRVRADLPPTPSGSSNYFTWGVRTLDFIPESAFVCEITGQYVLGKTANTQGEGTVTDVLLNRNDNNHSSSSSGSRPVRKTSTTRINPVGAWEEKEEIHSSSSAAASSASSSSTVDPALWAAQRAAQQALAAAGAEDDLALFEKTRAQLAETILVENEDLVRQFLDGELCIDSRRFGNVGSFIRRRPSHVSVGEGSLPASAAIHMDKMLRRKLVYTSLREDGQGPKLALFAARNIEPNTELLL